MKLQEMTGQRIDFPGPDGITAAYAEVTEDGVFVFYEEPWAWHAETFPDLLEVFGTDSGGLSVAAFEPVAKAAAFELERTREGLSESLQVQDMSGDDPGFEFSIALPASALGMTPEELEEAAWPFVVTMLNITDPGTFGVTYIMAEAARILEEES